MRDEAIGRIVALLAFYSDETVEVLADRMHDQVYPPDPTQHLRLLYEPDKLPVRGRTNGKTRRTLCFTDQP